jgi:hypothetical protein
VEEISVWSKPQICYKLLTIWSIVAIFIGRRNESAQSKPQICHKLLTIWSIATIFIGRRNESAQSKPTDLSQVTDNLEHSSNFYW